MHPKANRPATIEAAINDAIRELRDQPRVRGCWLVDEARRNGDRCPLCGVSTLDRRPSWLPRIEDWVDALAATWDVMVKWAPWFALGWVLTFLVLIGWSKW